MVDLKRFAKAVQQNRVHSFLETEIDGATFRALLQDGNELWLWFEICHKEATEILWSRPAFVRNVIHELMAEIGMESRYLGTHDSEGIPTYIFKLEVKGVFSDAQDD